MAGLLLLLLAQDPYRDGMEAYLARDFQRAVELLSRVPASHPQYAKAMRFVGYNIFVREWNRPQDGIPYVTRAWKAAPGDSKVMEDVTRAYAKAGRTFPPTDEEVRAILAAPLPAAAAGRPFGRAEAQADLDELARVIESDYSYADLKGGDWRGALKTMRDGLPQTITRDELALRVAKFLSRFGDGHTGVEWREPAGYAAVLFGEHEGRIFAFEPDRSSVLGTVTAIDGVPIARWLEAASSIVPKGADHFVRFHRARNLRFIAWLRTELGLPASGTVRFTIGPREVERPLAANRPTYADWPRGRTRKLDGDLGYLRIAEMADDEAFLASLDRAMADFRGTRGLVIDVRGNGGGSRAALRRLFPYFMKADEVRIANVAAGRIQGDDLSNRFLWTATANVWTAPQRGRIEAFLAGFKPEWTLPAGRLGDWHVMLLDRSLNESAYLYEAPVVVLCDAGCFSATDIFLGAFKGWRNVRLVGAASGGGSGRARPFALARSGIRGRISSMASFRPDGRLYDGRGVEPDVVVESTPEDWVGRTDSQLDAAVRLLRR
jgi:hypothetical protein